MVLHFYPSPFHKTTWPNYVHTWTRLEKCGQLCIHSHHTLSPYYIKRLPPLINPSLSATFSPHSLSLLISLRLGLLLKLSEGPLFLLYFYCDYSKTGVVYLMFCTIVNVFESIVRQLNLDYSLLIYCFIVWFDWLCSCMKCCTHLRSTDDILVCNLSFLLFLMNLNEVQLIWVSIILYRIEVLITHYCIGLKFWSLCWAWFMLFAIKF